MRNMKKNQMWRKIKRLDTWNVDYENIAEYNQNKTVFDSRKKNKKRTERRNDRYEKEPNVKHERKMK